MAKTKSITANNQAFEDDSNNALLPGSEGDNIHLGNTEFGAPTVRALAGVTELQLGIEQEALNIRDLIADHAAPDNSGGYLHFSISDGTVTLELDIGNPGGSANSTFVSLATIEGASGLSASQIMNSLLAHHEIKFD